MDKKFWVGLAISVVLLALFVRTVDLEAMLSALADADYALLVPAVALYMVSIGFRTLRWQRLLRHLRHVSFRRLYPVVVVGYMANNLLPVRLGELVRSHYVGERENISKVSALVTIFIERLLDALTLLVFVAVIAFFVPLVGVAEGFSEKSGIAWPMLLVAGSVPFVAAFGGLVTVALAPGRAEAFAELIIVRLPARAIPRLRSVMATFFLGVAPLGDLRSLPGLLLLSAPIWLFEAGLFFVIGYAFGLDEVYQSPARMAAAMLLVTAIANISSSIPAAPGGLGLFELVARETLVLLPLATVDRAVAAGYVAVVHATLLLPMIVLGQVFLWIEQASLRRLSREGRNLSDKTGGDLVVASSTESEEPQ